MTIKTNRGLRRVLSIAAFTTLVAAVTMAFAEAPQSRTSITLSKAEPALSTSPVPAIRLAEASGKKRKASAAKAKAASKTVSSKKGAKKPLTGTININIASADELTKLPGVGPKKASRIVTWRKQHGSFGRVVDLRRVKGFGAKSVKKLLPYLAIKGKHSLQ